jgi:hypothetical protein
MTQEQGLVRRCATILSLLTVLFGCGTSSPTERDSGDSDGADAAAGVNDVGPNVLHADGVPDGTGPDIVQADRAPDGNRDAAADAVSDEVSDGDAKDSNGSSVDQAQDVDQDGAEDSARDADASDVGLPCSLFPDIGCFTGALCASSRVQPICSNGTWVCPAGSHPSESCPTDGASESSFEGG